MLTFIPSRSCYYKIPREYFVPTALQFFATWIPLRIISRTFRVSAHPQLFRCFTKVFEILFNPPKILSSFIALQILVYLHYGCFPYIWQYSLVSFDTVILILFIQHVCECTQSSINPSKLSFRLRRHFWKWASSRPNYLMSIVTLVYTTYPSLIRASASDPLFWKS